MSRYLHTFTCVCGCFKPYNLYYDYYFPLILMSFLISVHLFSLGFFSVFLFFFRNLTDNNHTTLFTFFTRQTKLFANFIFKKYFWIHYKKEVTLWIVSMLFQLISHKSKLTLRCTNLKSLIKLFKWRAEVKDWCWWLDLR